MKTTLENSLESLLAAVPVLEGIQDWNEETIHASIMDLIAKMGIKNGQMLWPIRTAVSGWEVTPGGAIEIAEILGKDETLRRIRIGIERLKAATAG
jgi:glutamyl-tRNA synthetase